MTSSSLGGSSAIGGPPDVTGPKNRHAVVALVLPVLVFLFILKERADGNRDRQNAEARTLGGKSPKAPGGRQHHVTSSSPMRWSSFLPSRAPCPTE